MDAVVMVVLSDCFTYGQRRMRNYHNILSKVKGKCHFSFLLANRDLCLHEVTIYKLGKRMI